MSKKAVTDCPLNPFTLSGSSPPNRSRLRQNKKQDTSSPETQFFENKIGGEPSQDRWFSTEEAAEYLRIPVGTLRNMTSNGQVPHYKLGRLNRYLEFDLKKLLLRNKRGV